LNAKAKRRFEIAAMPSNGEFALVTGAGRRIGRDIALRLAREGYRIALHARRSGEDARAVAAEIAAAGGRSAIVAADLADPTEAMGLVGQAEQALGPLTLIVNSAAMFEPDSLANVDLALWRRQFAVNLDAPVFIAAAFAKALPAGREGAIVNIVDQRVLRLNPQNLSYTLAKSALWTATQTLAQALAPRIRVNAVGPGPTYANPIDGERGLEHEARATPLERRIRGSDIADAVVYLAQASRVTGQMIAVDSGQHLAWRTADYLD
jgi:NAD(P)-dependent dehydrogenase (short-subunit alcohol dehydrogenase family)